MNGDYKQIPLTQGLSAIVDITDFDWLNKWKWCALRDGRTFYAVRFVRKGGAKLIRMHREIMELKNGEYADHINGDGLDNRKSNLRLATASQNGANRRLGINNCSGIKGVIRLGNGWNAQITFHGKTKNLGHFADIESAKRQYQQAAIQLFGEFARVAERNQI